MCKGGAGEQRLSLVLLRSLSTAPSLMYKKQGSKCLELRLRGKSGPCYQFSTMVSMGQAGIRKG